MKPLTSIAGLSYAPHPPLPARVPTALWQSQPSAECTQTLGSTGDSKKSRDLKGTDRTQGYWQSGEAGGVWSSRRWPIVLGNAEGRAR